MSSWTYRTPHWSAEMSNWTESSLQSFGSEVPHRKYNTWHSNYLDSGLVEIDFDDYDYGDNTVHIHIKIVLCKTVITAIYLQLWVLP